MRYHLLGMIAIAVGLWHGSEGNMECEPSQYLCSWKCPPLPPDVEVPTSEGVCSKDPNTDACICWLHNPSSQLRTLFQCEARVNNSVSKITCIPPSHCFLPDPNLACLIVLRCPCVLSESSIKPSNDQHWIRVRAIVHTMKTDDQKNTAGQSVEKVQSDVREFSMKHLLFLVGFVIAPLLCWCLLNFFHEGKCRKKPLQPPEAQPMPTTRCSTVDDMNNEEGDVRDETVSIRPMSRHSDTVSVHMPSAPLEEELEGQQVKSDPPPYSADGTNPLDLGPPPTYEDAIRGTDINVQQLWQTVFILEPETQENS